MSARRQDSPRLPVLVVPTAVAVLFGSAPTAEARIRPVPPGEHAPSPRDFWRRPGRREKSRARRFEMALQLLRLGARAREIPGGMHGIHQSSLQTARDLLARLAREKPRNVAYWYWYGWAARALDDDPATLAAWSRVWKLDPHHWASADIAFALGVLYAKKGEYRKSVTVYRRGMPAAVDLAGRGIMASNCAESLMTLRNLKGAVRLYYRSLHLRPRRNAAAWWGLMVAYDRLGRTLPSQRAARQALTLDPYLQGLRGKDVFFVPPGDVHYYLALVADLQGRPRAALRRFARYLRAQPRSPWRWRVREHQRRLKRAIDKLRPTVSLHLVLPPSAQGTAQSLLPVVRRCYRSRAQNKPIPEGLLSIMIQVRRGRIAWSHHHRVLGDIMDPPVQRCVLRNLRHRRLRGLNRDRITVTFKLELTP